MRRLAMTAITALCLMLAPAHGQDMPHGEEFLENVPEMNIPGLHEDALKEFFGMTPDEFFNSLNAPPSDEPAWWAIGFADEGPIPPADKLKAAIMEVTYGCQAEPITRSYYTCPIIVNGEKYSEAEVDSTLTITPQNAPALPVVNINLPKQRTIVQCYEPQPLQGTLPERGFTRRCSVNGVLIQIRFGMTPRGGQES